MRRAVTGFATATLSGVRLDDVRTCVSEAVTNTVMHAFSDGRARGSVTVSAEFTQAALTVVVSDDGIGFGPRYGSPGIGLGLPTITALADLTTISRGERGGTQVSMTFALADAPS